MYFNLFKTLKYSFGLTGGIVNEIKDIFSRPIFTTNGADRLRIDNGVRPDQYAEILYGDNELFYINLLLNNHINKTEWPLNEIHFLEKLNDTYGGYGFHILEEVSDLNRGDVIVLVSDVDTVDAEGGEKPSYGVIDSWDPFLRKIHVKDYSFGTGSGSPTTTDALFKEGNVFRIFHRNINQTVNTDGVPVQNKNQFTGLTLNNFTMRKITKYVESADEFKYTSDIPTTLNPYMENIDIAGVSYNSVVADYSAGNTRGTCSLLDAYILFPSGDTGPDGGTFGTTSNVEIKTVKTTLTEENEEKRYIQTVRRNIVGEVLDDIRKEFRK